MPCLHVDKQPHLFVSVAKGKLVSSQAVQLVQKERQAQEDANAQRTSLQSEASEVLAAVLGSRPQRRLWEEIYTISYSRCCMLCGLSAHLCPSQI